MVGRTLCKCGRSSRFVLKSLILIGVSVFVIPPGITYGETQPPAKSQPAPLSAPLVVMTPEAVKFSDVPVGDTYTQTVRITNVAENTLLIKEIKSSRPEFRVVGIFLPVVVAHGTSESFTIAYRATSERQVDGQISILTNAGSEPVVLSVKASAAAGQTELTASEAGLDFADVAVGTSNKREIVLSNSGNRDLTISAIAASGSAFSVAGASALNLSAGQSIRVDVNFAPLKLGRQVGSFIVSSADGTALATIPLAGTAAAASQSTVRLNWEESPVAVAGYAIYRSAEPSGPYTRISTEVPAPEFVDSGLAAGHTYYYVVASLDSDQAESESSAPIVATIPEG